MTLHTASTSQLRIEFESDESPLFVYADANRLEQVGGNLLSTTVKFTAPAD